MSDQNVFVKFAKKSVGLPTGESSCCGSATPLAGQETAKQVRAKQTVNTSSCCALQGSADLLKDETSSCECTASQETTQHGFR